MSGDLRWFVNRQEDSGGSIWRGADAGDKDLIICLIRSRNGRKDQDTVSSAVDGRTVFVPLVGEAIPGCCYGEDSLLTQADREAVRLPGNLRRFIHRELGNLRSIRWGADTGNDDEVIASISRCDISKGQNTVGRSSNGCVVVIPLVGKSIAGGSDGKANSVANAGSEAVRICGNLRRFIDGQEDSHRSIWWGADTGDNDLIAGFIGSRDSRQDQNTVGSPIDGRTVFVPLVREAIASSSDRENCLLTQTDREAIRLPGDLRWFVDGQEDSHRSIWWRTDTGDNDLIAGFIGSRDSREHQNAISCAIDWRAVFVPLVGEAIAGSSDREDCLFTQADCETIRLSGNLRWFIHRELGNL